VVVERPALGLKDRSQRIFATWRPVGLPADVTPAPVPAAPPSDVTRTKAEV
jgi:hypothetical protein